MGRGRGKKMMLIIMWIRMGGEGVLLGWDLVLFQGISIFDDVIIFFLHMRHHVGDTLLCCCMFLLSLKF